MQNNILIFSLFDIYNLVGTQVYFWVAEQDASDCVEAGKTLVAVAARQSPAAMEARRT